MITGAGPATAQNAGFAAESSYPRRSVCCFTRAPRTKSGAALPKWLAVTGDHRMRDTDVSVPSLSPVAVRAEGEQVLVAN